VTVLELHNDVYVEIARAAGDQPLTVHLPYDIALTPTDLVD
jgi:hypothetical protein